MLKVSEDKELIETVSYYQNSVYNDNDDEIGYIYYKYYEFSMQQPMLILDNKYDISEKEIMILDNEYDFIEIDYKKLNIHDLREKFKGGKNVII